MNAILVYGDIRSMGPDSICLFRAHLENHPPIPFPVCLSDLTTAACLSQGYATYAAYATEMAYTYDSQAGSRCLKDFGKYIKTKTIQLDAVFPPNAGGVRHDIC
jgi:hypothetical protein